MIKDFQARHDINSYLKREERTSLSLALGFMSNAKHRVLCIIVSSLKDSVWTFFKVGNPCPFCFMVKPCSISIIEIKWWKHVHEHKIAQSITCQPQNQLNYAQCSSEKKTGVKENNGFCRILIWVIIQRRKITLLPEEYELFS